MNTIIESMESWKTFIDYARDKVTEYALIVSLKKNKGTIFFEVDGVAVDIADLY